MAPGFLVSIGFGGMATLVVWQHYSSSFLDVEGKSSIFFSGGTATEVAVGYFSGGKLQVSSVEWLLESVSINAKGTFAVKVRNPQMPRRLLRFSVQRLLQPSAE